MPVYLHWKDFTPDGLGQPTERRAAYASKEDALTQARHDINQGLPVVGIKDADGTEIVSVEEIKSQADKEKIIREKAAANAEKQIADQLAKEGI